MSQSVRIRADQAECAQIVPFRSAFLTTPEHSSAR